MSRLVTQCESLRGFKNPRGRGENDAPRSLLRHSRPNRECFKTEETRIGPLTGLENFASRDG